MELAVERIQKFRTNELLNHFDEMTTLIDMRPLFHPSMKEVKVEGVLHALSDPVRVAMYVDIVAQECPQSSSNFLKVSDKAIPKSTLSQHFKILREAWPDSERAQGLSTWSSHTQRPSPQTLQLGRLTGQN